MAPREELLARNAKRPECQAYDPAILDALLMRYEDPQSMNRWDTPLFHVNEGNRDQVCDQIAQVLLQKRPPPPNQSTQAVRY